MYQQNREPRDDIRVGEGRVVIHIDGGWALPGQQRTTCRETAIETARRIHELVTAQAAENAIPKYEEVKIIRRRKF